MKKLALLSALITLPFIGCAHISQIIKDVQICASENPVLHDVEMDVGPAVERILECDPSLSADALPGCAESALSALIMSLGPDGFRFVTCVVSRVEGDTAASKLAQSRAKAYIKKHLVR